MIIYFPIQRGLTDRDIALEEIHQTSDEMWRASSMPAELTARSWSIMHPPNDRTTWVPLEGQDEFQNENLKI